MTDQRQSHALRLGRNGKKGKITAHIAHTGDALSNEERQGWLPSQCQMNVHVPKTGNQKLSPSVHHQRILWRSNFPRFAQRRDSVA